MPDTESRLIERAMLSLLGVAIGVAAGVGLMMAMDDSGVVKAKLAAAEQKVFALEKSAKDAAAAPLVEEPPKVATKDNEQPIGDGKVVAISGGAGEIVAAEDNSKEFEDSLGLSRADITRPLGKTYNLQQQSENKNEAVFSIGDSTVVSLVGPAENLKKITVITDLKSGEDAGIDAGRAIRVFAPALVDSKWFDAWLVGAFNKVTPSHAIRGSNRETVITVVNGKIDKTEVLMISFEHI